MAPTKEPLQIIIGGLDGTLNISPDTITINLERGNRVSTASFTLKNGASFGIIRWQTVLIMSPEDGTQYFFGYITDYELIKRGITRDYNISCSSIEVRLQKSTVNNICNGTDTEIITCLFANSLPDLTSLFDLTGITDLRLDSFDFPALDTNIFDALDQLSSKVDANYSWSRDNAARINYNNNPNIDDSFAEYGSNLPSGHSWEGIWIPGNTTWNAGGYVDMVSTNNGTQNRSYIRIGSANDGATSKMLLVGGDNWTNKWLLFSATINVTTTTTATFTGQPYIYDEDNNFLMTLSGDLELTVDENNDETFFMDWDIGAEAPGLPDRIRVEIILFILTTNFVHTATFDNCNVEMVDSSGTPTQGAYFDGATSGAVWDGTANASKSLLLGTSAMNWSDTPPDASYDVDIGTSDYIDDLNLEDMALDGINTVVVTGAFVYVAIDYEYPSNNQLTHFDLEASVFPAEGATYPVIYKNTGSDVTPIWTAQDVGNRIDNTLGVGGIDVLYDKEDHWLEFQTAPSDLKRGFRVVGRLKTRLRAVVEDELQVASDGVQLVDAIYNETAATEADVFELGLAELARRAGTRRISFTTLEPGLNPGDEIDVTDTAQGISETVIIERVTKRYGIEGEHGGGYVRSEVEAGDRNPDLADFVAQGYQMATDRPPITADTANQALTQLYDDDNLPLWDDDNAALYQSTGA